MSLLDGVTVRPSGEAAVVLELGDHIDPTLHDRVMALDDELRAAPPPGLVEVVPTYRSLLLRLDPSVTTPDATVAALEQRATPSSTGRREPRVHRVRMSVAAADAEDLAEVADRTGHTADEVVGLLTAGPLRLYCYGFVPGFAYLGGVPAALELPRRETPREPVVPGAVLLAAGQAALCPMAIPTGWWVVGRTDTALFDPDHDPPVPFEPGDAIWLTT